MKAIYSISISEGDNSRQRREVVKGSNVSEWRANETEIRDRLKQIQIKVTPGYDDDDDDDESTMFLFTKASGPMRLSFELL